MKRAKLHGLQRNAAIVLGNVGSDEDVAVLVDALGDPEPLVRAHAAWALGRIGHPSTAISLRLRPRVEAEDAVIASLEAALETLDG